MKKKIINGILMVALVAATSASFVSCKDNDEDMQAEFLALQQQNQTDLNDLKKKIERLDAADSCLITSVIVNATSTSILDNSKLFPGVNMQFLGTTYGEAGLPVSFPSVAEYTGTKFTAVAGDKLFEKDATIYFTANPSNIDAAKMAKVNLSLINSQGTAYSDLTLGTAEKSDKVLTWGTTRGANGATDLWKASVSVSDPTKLGQLDPTQIIDAKEAVEHVKNIIEESKGVNKSNAKAKAKAILSETATALTEAANITLPELPALGLKAQWSCLDVNDPTKTRTFSTVSDYSLAATAFKPIDFYYGQGIIDPNTKVSIDILDRAVAKIVKRLKKELGKINKDLNNINIDSIEVKGDFSRGYKFYYELKTKTNSGVSLQFINGLKIQGIKEAAPTPIGSIIGGEKTDGWFELDEFSVDFNEDIDSLVADIQKGINIAPLINDLVKVLGDANKYADRATSLSNRITNTLNNFANNLITKFANDGFYTILQPVMLIDNGEATCRLVTGATIKKGSYTLVPTTVTNELLAPAFKKYVAVKKDGAVKAEKLMTKGEANFDNYAADLSEAGSYEIIYAALDFYGNEIVKRYNVTVQ
ncbi:hypothetical protein [Xylanibacter ruminicola]|uniref:Lipoprotein n=1 Tax=Xylanibacter ruminicola TaxID=839 RepID=A0A1M6YIE0_XYLRU|nr:hypothetical protein [Xylanibacter ruminicola]SHL18114.1 hypothetical protein SAMN05216463_12822 [Xylanibacter ruminicola]